MLAYTIWHLLAISFVSATTVAASGFRTIPSQYSTKNQIRVKSHGGNDVCRGGSPSHSGWADVDEHHLFFWYFEARKPKPDTPVMVWFTGGPGGSSIASALVENGDCLYDSATKGTKLNPYAWTEEFHMVYLDQPAGVGLSYTTNSSAGPSTTDEGAPDIIAFLRLFGEAFPDLARQPLHLAGESYGGRYIPTYGHWIQQYNHIVDPDDRLPLASLISISAWTHPAIQIPSIYDVACHPFKEFQPTLNSSTCEAMAAAYQPCEEILHACKTTEDPLACGGAEKLCHKAFMEVIQSEYTNKYDRRMTCKKPGECYPVMNEMQDYVNSMPILDTLLEAPEQSDGQIQNFSFMNTDVYQRFQESGDMFQDTIPHVEAVLSKTEVPMLFTASDADILVNPKGLRESLEGAKWHGRPAFRGSPWEELPFRTLSGKPGGVLRRSGQLWYTELAESGHMAPHDQRAGSLELMKLWLRHVLSGDEELNIPLRPASERLPSGPEDL